MDEKPRCESCSHLIERLWTLYPRRGNRRMGYIYEVPGDLLAACRATDCAKSARQAGMHQEDAPCRVVKVALSRDIALRGAQRGQVVGEVWWGQYR